MKILHLCLGNFFIDNYSYQENMLTKYHAKMGHDVTVIASLFTFGPDGKGMFLSGPSEYKDANGVNVIRLAYRKPHRLFKTIRRYEGLWEKICKVAPDTIFSHNIQYADITIVKKYMKAHPNVKLFADNHGDFINSAKNWMSRHVKHPIMWKHYAKVIEPYLTKCYGVTPMRCRFLKEMYHLNPQLVEFLPMGVDDEAIPADRVVVRQKIREELDIKETDFLIFTGGKIDKLKNTHVLLEALNQINNQKVHIVICGTLTPEMEYLKASFNNNKHIHYLGWCNAERVMNCMVASDLACFPGTHSTLWEQSVGLGLPAVFKRWNEMEHVNVNGNCIFVKGDNLEELITTLCNVVDDSNIYEELKVKSSMASSSFLYSNIAKQAIMI